jgi:hypothetical protein
VSATNVTIWNCDRCDKEVTMPERGQPPQWSRLMKSTPPLAAPGEVDRKYVQDWQLCHDCSEALHDWMIVKP